MLNWKGHNISGSVKGSQKSTAGVLTSPNFPGRYPNNLAQTHILQVQEGLVLSLEFTAFDVELNSNLCIDSVMITAGDGRILSEGTCGGSTYGNIVVGGQSRSTILPASVKSRGNVVNVIFTTSVDYTRRGWQITWSAVSPVPATGDFSLASILIIWQIVVSTSCCWRLSAGWLYYWK